MAAPQRTGLELKQVQRRIAPLDRARDEALRHLRDRTAAGGTAVVWYREGRGVDQSPLGIAPGVADDLPSLLSALAGELGWPGIPCDDPARATDRPFDPQATVAAWARVWQVRDEADLRVVLWWDTDGAFHAEAALLIPRGEKRLLHDVHGIADLLDQVATAPRASASPHGQVLAGHRAMEAGDYTAARDQYTEAALHLPRDPEVRRGLALALAHLDAWEAAADAMRTARDLAPQDALLGQEYLALETDAGVRAAQQGDLARAAEHFLRVLALWPDEPTALANLGNIRLREERFPEARAIFTRFLRLHPKHAGAEQIRQALAELG